MKLFSNETIYFIIICYNLYLIHHILNKSQFYKAIAPIESQFCCSICLLQLNENDERFPSQNAPCHTAIDNYR